jgi:hypothetical protein
MALIRTWHLIVNLHYVHTSVVRLHAASQWVSLASTSCILAPLPAEVSAKFT